MAAIVLVALIKYTSVKLVTTAAMRETAQFLRGNLISKCSNPFVWTTQLRKWRSSSGRGGRGIGGWFSIA
jgi:hypothetical protein